MTTTVFRIFNDYFQKIPEWQSEAFNMIAQKAWNSAKNRRSNADYEFNLCFYFDIREWKT